jgi:hypothetical protein
VLNTTLFLLDVMSSLFEMKDPRSPGHSIRAGRPDRSEKRLNGSLFVQTGEKGNRTAIAMRSFARWTATHSPLCNCWNIDPVLSNEIERCSSDYSPGLTRRSAELVPRKALK